MLNRRFLLELSTIVIVSVLCAVVANAIAARERKLPWSGNYPRALVVPTTTAGAVPPAPAAGNLVEASATARAAVTEAVPVETAPARAQGGLPVSGEVVEAPAAAGNEPVKQPERAATKAAEPKPVEQPLTQLFPADAARPWVEISGESALLLHRRGARFFDARRASAWAEGRIPGAIQISPWEGDLEEKLMRVFEMNLDSDQPVVVYCTGGNCEDSHMLGERLYGLNLNNVLVYKDGYPDWLQRGMPVERGTGR